VLRKKCFHRFFDFISESIQHFKDAEFKTKLPSIIFVKIIGIFSKQKYN